MFKEIEDMVVGYMDIDEYKNIVYGIFFELLLFYREFEYVFLGDKVNIWNRVKIVEYYCSKFLYEKVSWFFKFG